MSIIALLALTVTLSGCIKPFKKPIIETIEPNESAVMIQLVGDNSNQDQAKSEQFYKDNMVFVKEVEIPQYEVKTGRMYWSIDWRPAARLIKVSRAPESRDWINGTDGTSSVNQGFDVESKDSIGFSFGVVAAAQIDEVNVAKFLYIYSDRPLEKIMDAEIRNHIQAILSDVATKYTLDEIDIMKQEAISTVRDIVIPYFAERGITITNIGLKGGLWYEDVAIQRAFNNVIVEQKAAIAQIAANEKLDLAAATLNGIKIKNATADKEAAEIRESAWEVYAAMRQIEIQEVYAQALLEHGFPTTLVGESTSMILDIGKAE